MTLAHWTQICLWKYIFFIFKNHKVFLLFFFFKKIFFNVYSFLRDRVQAGEGQTQNPKQALGSELSAQIPTWGLNHEPWEHDLSRGQMLNRLNHPGIPFLWMNYMHLNRFDHFMTRGYDLCHPGGPIIVFSLPTFLPPLNYLILVSKKQLSFF